jgi:oxygen-independent coproporphyrinogen-3 oxidase
LIEEFEYRSKDLAQPATSVYLGGGSPLVLGLENLNSFLERIQKHISKDTEITIEINPEHLENERFSSQAIALLKRNRVNRISIGVQTTDTKTREYILRCFDANKLLALVERLKKDDFIVSFDFMFGLPDQTLELLGKDIDFIRKNRPHHVSMYLFTPPERYTLTKRLPDEDTIEKMFFLTHNELEAFGYSHYEVSNYALGTYESVHNIAYWKRDAYIGLGAGAHSFYKQKDIRAWHQKDVAAYIKDPKHLEFEDITKEMEYTETIMLGLRLLKVGIPISFFKNKNYRELMDSGLLVQKEDNVVVPAKAIPVLDAIIKELA